VTTSAASRDNVLYNNNNDEPQSELDTLDVVSPTVNIKSDRREIDDDRKLAATITRTPTITRSGRQVKSPAKYDKYIVYESIFKRIDTIAFIDNIHPISSLSMKDNFFIMKFYVNRIRRIL
jgi:hypothetical protein